MTVTSASLDSAASCERSKTSPKGERQVLPVQTKRTHVTVPTAPPLVVPPEVPLNPDLPRPPALERFRESLSDRRGYRWVEEMFRRHRHR